MELKDSLIENATEYFKNATEAHNRNEYNTSVTLFFKTLSALSDLNILIHEGKMPTSHSERFRILQQKYQKFYFILDKDFPFYQESYRTKLDKETSLMFEEDARELFRILNIAI